MEWLSEVSDARTLMLRCIALEQVRYSGHFNVLLARNRLSYLRVLRQLKRSRRAAKYDYRKGSDGIPCFGFVAGKTADNPALSFEVSFEQAPDGATYLWIQEFHA